MSGIYYLARNDFSSLYTYTFDKCRFLDGSTVTVQESLSSLLLTKSPVNCKFINCFVPWFLPFFNSVCNFYVVSLTLTKVPMILYSIYVVCYLILHFRWFTDRLPLSRSMYKQASLVFVDFTMISCKSCAIEPSRCSETNTVPVSCGKFIVYTCHVSVKLLVSSIIKASRWLKATKYEEK